MYSDDISDVINLISDIKHKKIIYSCDIALKTEELLEHLIGKGQWKSAKQLMDEVRLRIKCIQESLPQEATATNILRHVLKIIRDEYEASSKQKGEGHSLHQMITGNPEALNYSDQFSDLRPNLLEHLSEYKFELETSTENIATQASEHIHSNELILTVGRSNCVEKFFKSAAKKRSFNVIVVEGAPFYYGHSMAASLAKMNIETTVIPDSAVFALMSRVNKVIIGTHTVLANGGLRAASGVHAVALAAKHYSVPVMVLSHMYKFTPLYVSSQDQQFFNICASPANVIPTSAGQLVNKIEIFNPVYDYVPPELVTLLVSHQGGNAPSYVYRLLSELYHPEDYDV